MLSDSSYFPLSIDDEDDEDYSLKDDLRKNARIFKDEDDGYLKRNTEPILRKEIDDLMAESHRPLDPDYPFFSQAYQPNKRQKLDYYPGPRDAQPKQIGQLNYYYNVNNNFGAGDDTKSLGSKKQVKSIEVQVTPEKLKEKHGDGDLAAAGGVGVDPPKKKRKRRTKEEVIKAEQQQRAPPPMLPWQQFNPYHQGYYP